MIHGISVDEKLTKKEFMCKNRSQEERLPTTSIPQAQYPTDQENDQSVDKVLTCYKSHQAWR